MRAGRSGLGAVRSLAAGLGARPGPGCTGGAGIATCAVADACLPGGVDHGHRRGVGAGGREGVRGGHAGRAAAVVELPHVGQRRGGVAGAGPGGRERDGDAGRRARRGGGRDRGGSGRCSSKAPTSTRGVQSPSPSASRGPPSRSRRCRRRARRPDRRRPRAASRAAGGSRRWRRRRSRVGAGRRLVSRRRAGAALLRLAGDPVAVRDAVGERASPCRPGATRTSGMPAPVIALSAIRSVAWPLSLPSA